MYKGMNLDPHFSPYTHVFGVHQRPHCKVWNSANARASMGTTLQGRVTGKDFLNYRKY